VLVVDDLFENRYYLETILASAGHTAVSAGDGAEALALAAADPPDLALSDILMPVMDGFALCRAWKQDPALARIPFIFYTATYTEAQDEAFALDLGADRFLTKPLPADVLLREVAAFLDRSAASPPAPGLAEEAPYLRAYSETLFRKLQMKQAEVTRLEATLARFGRMLAASTSQIFIFNGDTLRFTFANQGALERLGCTGAELEALTLLDLCPDLDPARAGEVLEPLRSGRLDQSIQDWTLAPRRGGPFPAEVHLEPILDGQELSFLMVVQDVTERRRQEAERRRLEAEVHQAQKLESLGRMATGVAHDLNNLLTPVLVLAGSLRERTQDRPELHRALDTIEMAAGKGSALVRELTEFARQDLPHPQPVDLNALARQTLDLLKADAAPGLGWRQELAEGLPAVQGDPSALGRALLNLGRNALDAMGPAGTLAIGTGRAPDGGLEVWVADTGHGIPAELLPQVTEPFFTTKGPGKGTGLGLAIVAGIVRSHAGALAIESEPGRGTTVRIRLPGPRTT
jgi:PAS domain S-box-containing protein